MKTNKLRTIDEFCNRPIETVKKRLQNYKKCIGCGASYDLDIIISKCELCGCKKFIHDTDYM